MFDLWSEGPQAYTGARHPPRTSCTTPTPGESAVMFGVIIPDPLQKSIFDGLVRSITTLPGDVWAGSILE